MTSASSTMKAVITDSGRHMKWAVHCWTGSQLFHSL